MWVHHDLFFATRIQINVSWSGSGSNQIQIQNTDASYDGFLLYQVPYGCLMVISHKHT